MIKTILISLILFGSNLLFAQEVDGYYINKSGDTLRGKIDIPSKKEMVIVGSSRYSPSKSTISSDPLKGDSIKESKKINYSKLTFDFKFSEAGSKYKKIDRLKIKGFGFSYEGRQYDFITWDVTADKQLYLIPPTGDVVPDGVYFILLSINGHFPIYSLFQDVEILSATLTQENNRPGLPPNQTAFYRNAVKRDIIFKHPSKGYIYISDQYPLTMKFSEAIKYFDLEDEFVKTLNKTDLLLDVIKKYNAWKIVK